MIDWGLFLSFKLFLHTFSYHCIHIDAAAEGVVYEVVAKPQEPQGQAPQQEDRGESAQGHLTLVLSSRRKASPGACPIILNYDSIYICFIYYLCITY